MRVVSDWSELQEKAVEMGSVLEFKGRLDDFWLSVLGEDSLRVVGLMRVAEGNACHLFYPPVIEAPLIQGGLGAPIWTIRYLALKFSNLTGTIAAVHQLVGVFYGVPCRPP